MYFRNDLWGHNNIKKLYKFEESLKPFFYSVNYCIYWYIFSKWRLVMEVDNINCNPLTDDFNHLSFNMIDQYHRTCCLTHFAMHFAMPLKTLRSGLNGVVKLPIRPDHFALLRYFWNVILAVLDVAAASEMSWNVFSMLQIQHTCQQL